MKKATLALLLAAGVAVAGGGWYALKHKQADTLGGDVSTAAPDGPMAIQSCTARLHDGKPALAIMLSEAIQNDDSFTQFVQVTDNGKVAQKDSNNAKKASASATAEVIKAAWVVADNPRVLIMPEVKPGHKYSINVAAGLAGRSGHKLEVAYQCEVQADEMSPSYFFASKGSLLPAGLNGGLPIVTVNVAEVDVEFLRIREDNIPKFFDLVAGKNHRSDEEEESNGDYYYDYYGTRNRFKGQTYGYQLNSLSTISESVYQNRFETTKDANLRKTSFLPVEKIKELQEPGIYVAVMRRPGNFDNDYQVSYFFVTDVGVHVRKQPKLADVFATSLKTGKALGGIEIEVLDTKGKRLVQGKTDSNGHAVLPPIPAQAKLLIARNGKEISVLGLNEPGLDLAEFDIGGHLPSDTKLFPYSGRDLYRPGEKFNVSLVARTADGKLAPAAPIKAILKKPDGESYNASIWQANAKTPGYYQQRIDLPADAATGMWSLEFRADPASKAPDSVMRFQVEEFLPERMKLILKSDEKPLLGKEGFSVNVQGDYLYGAPAAGNRLLASVSQERVRVPLKKAWPGFIVGDFDDDSIKSREEVPESELDAQGKAEVEVGYNPSKNSVLNVRAAFSLLESGGRPVVRSIERQWWPAKAVLGLRPLFDSDVSQENSLAEFELSRFDSSGKVAPQANINFRVVREDRQYYWRYEQNRGWTSGFTENEEVVHSGVTQVVSDKRSRLAVPVTWGRFRIELTDPSTQLTTRYRFYAGWNAQDAESMGNRPDRVKIQLEGVPAKIGNSVKAKIFPPHDGEALIMVEADKVLWSKRIDVSTKGTEITIPLEKEWQRSDMYLSTIVFRPGNQGDKVTPARAIGMTWLPLARDDRQLKVSVDAPARVEPEKRMVAKVKVEGAANQTARVTLSAVDVGILNITNFATPDPFNFFFGKHRFSPELADVYGKLIERMDGQVGKIKWGGDAGKRDTQSMPQKVKLVDLFSGLVMVNAKGEAEIPLNIPDFNGTLRLMAVANTDLAYGKAEKEVVVSAPIVAEISLPRFIGPGDQSMIAVDVTNMLDDEQNISIKMSADHLLKVGEGERVVKLKSKQREVLRMQVEPKEAYGLSRVSLDINSTSVAPAAGKASKPVVIHREFALQIQPPIPREQENRRVRVEPGSTYKVDAAMLDRYFKGSSTLSVSVSNKPPLNIQSLVKGLLDYPYGCLEQTTSAAYPHVFIDEAAAKTYGLKPRSREERARFIEGAIGRIGGMQGASGGYRLWGGDSGQYEGWLTPYVTAFLMDAREAGFNVPDDMNKRAMAWMTERLNGAANQFPSLPKEIKRDAEGNYPYRDFELLRNSHQRFAELAHIGYMLARDQKASLAALRLLHDQYRARAASPLPLVHLGLALQLMGDAKRASVAFDEAMEKTWGIQRNGYDWLGDYGTSLRDNALAYALLTRHKVSHPKLELMFMNIANDLNKQRWYYSTQERLALFLAARQAGGDTSEAWNINLVNADKAQNYSAKDSQTFALEAAQLAKGVSIENKGKQVIWLDVESTGFPLKVANTNSDKLSVERRWYTTDGKPWKGGPLKVGDMLLVKVTAKAKQNIEDGLIVDHVPAGLEIENENISKGPQANEFAVDGINLAAAMADTRIKHREFRDDRFVVAAQISAQPINLFYMLRVVTPGKYSVPGTYAEDMYRADVRNVGPAGESITILDPRAKK